MSSRFVRVELRYSLKELSPNYMILELELDFNATAEYIDEECMSINVSVEIETNIPLL